MSEPSIARLIAELREPVLPNVYWFTDLNDELFDPCLRHKSDKGASDYLKAWLRIFRNFAYATHDDSWGELEKEITIVLANYCQGIKRQERAADALERLLTADETRVRDISRLTIERDTARDELAAAKGALEKLEAEKAELLEMLEDYEHGGAAVTKSKVETP